METLRCFVGFDAREAAAYHVCCQSILENTKSPVSFHPVRGETRDGSNSFTYARFLIPYLCGYKGQALFLDGDMLVTGDIAELFDLSMAYHGVRVVKHDYKTRHPVKYLGAKNEDYPRKNWSSAVMWNCGYYPNRILEPESVKNQTGAYLHRFAWLQDEQIGDLPYQWNHLVSELPECDAKNYHFTVGLPAFAGYENQEAADRWFACRQRAMTPNG